LLAFADAASAQNTFEPEQVKSGSETYARHCAPCHGPRMANPEGAPDLRKFRAINASGSSHRCRRARTPCRRGGDLLKADEIDALWAYVAAGGKN